MPFKVWPPAKLLPIIKLWPDYVTASLSTGDALNYGIIVSLAFKKSTILQQYRLCNQNSVKGGIPFMRAIFTLTLNVLFYIWTCL